MYGAYARTVSPFQNSDMMATGLPSPEELQLLEPFRGQVPDEVFGEPFVPPVSDGSGQDRTLLRKAQQLLKEAGFPSRMASGCRRTAKSSRSSSCSTSRRSSRTTRPISRTSARSGSRPTSGLSTPCSPARGVEDFDFDMTIAALQLVADAGRRPAAATFRRGPRPPKDRTTWRASRTRDRRADRQGDRRRYPRRTDVSRAARLIACFAPAVIGCRNGIRTTRLPIGTCSGIRRACRDTRRAPARRKSGGRRRQAPRQAEQAK